MVNASPTAWRAVLSAPSIPDPILLRRRAQTVVTWQEGKAHPEKESHY